MMKSEMKTFLHAALVLLLAASLFFMNDCRSSNEEKLIERPISVSDAHETIQVPLIREEDDTIRLDISVQRMNRYGYHAGDIVSIKPAEKIIEVPIFAQEAEQTPAIVYLCGKDNKDEVLLEGIGIPEGIEDVTVDLKTKQGLSGRYPLDEYVYGRTNERSDYEDLSDEDYANFRMVKTDGIKEGILYRSSSPVNPKILRSGYADAAAKDAGIRTILNLADHPYEFSLFEDKEKTYYVSCDCILLDLSASYHTKEFEEGLARGLRYMIGKEGPYLIHCTEGKDRTGFVCAVLECLMSASIDEVISDYMKTYQNYYGTGLGTFVYDRIVQNRLLKDLQRAFESEDLFEEDLSLSAFKYLERIGLKEEEIVMLKEKLS